MTGSPVVVTGAGGFVCSEVCVALTQAGHAVLALDRHFDAPTRARLSGVWLIEGEVSDTLATLSLSAPAAVIHGAAVTASPEALGISRTAHIKRNMDMHLATLDWAQQSGTPRFLFLSSMGVFAADDAPAHNGTFTEATIPTADCAYCVAKRMGEMLTTTAAQPGFATLSLRLGGIVGPHEVVRDTRRILCLINRMLAEARATGIITVATPDALREWAWLPDLAQGIAALAVGFDATTPPMIHAGQPPAMRELDLARAIAERLPGTTLRIASPPHAALRPPMATAYPSAMPTDWTPIPRLLDLLIAPAAAA